MFRRNAQFPGKDAPFLFSSLVNHILVMGTARVKIKKAPQQTENSCQEKKGRRKEFSLRLQLMWDKDKQLRENKKTTLY